MICKEDVAAWWDLQPQLYGEDTFQEEDAGYFCALDDAIFSVSYDGNPPYAELIDRLLRPDDFAGKRVLEIGYGSGWMLERLARRGCLVSGVDLTEAAYRRTTRRFELFGLDGDIRLADGEHLPYDDATFDLVYSIGVLHHTPDIEAAVREIHRTLKPGGRLLLMLYSRDSVFFRFMTWIRGKLEFESLFLDERALVNRWTDGWELEGNFHTKPLGKAEVVELLRDFDDLEMLSFYFNLPLPWASRIPAVVRRFYAKRFGWFRYLRGRKPRNGR